MNKEIRKLRQSFSFAISGLRLCIKTERNFRIHLTAVFYVSVFSLLGEIGIIKYAILCLCFSIMMSMELINTSIERLCDKQVTGYDQTVKQAKDIAAAAVFICAIFCAIIGIIFFVPSGAITKAVYILSQNIFLMTVVTCTIPLAYFFVFGYNKK